MAKRGHYHFGTTGKKSGEWKVIRLLLGHNSLVNSIQFGSSSYKLITGSVDCTAKIWMGSPDGAWDCIHTLEHKSEVVHAEFGFGEERVLTVSKGGTAAIWEREGGEPWKIKKLLGDDVKMARFSSYGNFVVTAQKDGANVWRYFDELGWICIAALGGLMNDVMSVCFRPDGKEIVTASKDTSVKIWDSFFLEPTLSSMLLFVLKFKDSKLFEEILPSFSPEIRNYFEGIIFKEASVNLELIK